MKKVNTMRSERRMLSKINRFCLLALFISSMLFSISALLSVPRAYAGSCKLGVVLPLSGDLAGIGNNLLNAVKLSADKMKAEKGIEFELVVRDDRNDPAEAEKVAKELVNDPGLVGIVGHYYSSTAMGAAKVYDQAKIPVLCVYASDQELTKSSRYIFSMNYSNKTQSEYMAVYLKELLKKDNILVINNNDAYGISLRDSFLEKTRRLGLKVYKHLEYDHHKKFEDDYISTSLPDKEANKNIGAVAVFSHSESGIKLVKQLRDHGIQALIIGPNTWFTDQFFNPKLIPEEQTANVYITAPFLWEVGNYRAFSFSEDYRRRFAEAANITAPVCYDAILLFASAVKDKGAARESIRDYFDNLTWQKSVPGITGNIYFNKDRMADRDVFLSEIKDGRFKVNYVQLGEPREPYVFKEKDERLQKGSLIEVDGKLYHWIDVVFVGVDFFRVNDVNMQKMSFDIEFYLWYKWMGNSIDVSQMDILNAFTGTSTLIKEDLSKPVKYKCFRYKGSYVKPFDLSSFPYDTQELPITVGHKSKNSTHLMLVTDSRHMTHEALKEIYPQEWTYVGKNFSSGLHRQDSTFGDPDYRLGSGYKSKIYFSTATVFITLKRIIFPYLFNIFLPLAIILFIAILIIYIPTEQIVLRLQLSMTALLSIIVYHLAQKNSLPKVGYLMKVDWYFIIAYCFILSVIFLNIIVVRMVVRKNTEKAQKLNKCFVLGLIPLAILAFAIATFV